MNATIDDVVAERGIREVLHFTTNHGLIGVFASGAVLSRDHLKTEDLLDSVKLLNCAVRRDPAWTSYVNLSISAVNKDFLGASTGWHPPRDGVWWSVLSFSPTILTDEGVVFTTTNNVYHAVVQRGEGLTGLEAMFAQAVAWGYYDTIARRDRSTALNMPTHVQAEVLYPNRVDLAYLQAIYVPTGEHVDDVRGLMASIPGAPQVPVEVRQEVFQ